MDLERFQGRFKKLRQRVSTDADACDAIETWFAQCTPLERLRANPYALAEAVGLPIRPVVSVLLQGTQVGLFELHWDIHCPHCNMLTESLPELRQVTGEARCEMCKFSFSADFSQRIEVTFSISPELEDLKLPPFCAPPAILNSRYNIGCTHGETKSAVETLGPGVYRYGCALTRAKGVLTVQGAASEQVQEALITQESGPIFSPPELTLRPGPIRLILHNGGHPFSGLYVHTDELAKEIPLSALPRRMSGFELIHHQDYARLFGSKPLSQRERLSIASVTIVFTDITGSTRIYEQLGDADAYNMVRDHFEYLIAATEKHGGTVLKTIGDAVMASFLSNSAALLAIDESMHRLRAHNLELPEDRRIRLRFGIHSGPAILVTLNERLDYFGRTVNKAARIQSVAHCDEVSVSSEVFADPEFQSARQRVQFSEFRETAEDLKGIDGTQLVYTARFKG